MLMPPVVLHNITQLTSILLPLLAWPLPSLQRMMSEMERMSKQWREAGKVSGGFFWPGGGFNYRAESAGAPSDASAPNSSSANSPSLPLDVVSTDGFYLLYADVPGLAKADLSIKLSKELVLTLSGERKPPVDEGFTQQERAAGPFSRSWPLPEDADSEGISAKVSEGVLTITVPKKQPEPEVDDSQEISIN
jgi:HSP20 family protein